MQWILAFHIIFMVAWFAGLFYLPRLFLYHTRSKDVISIERFKVMERKLYFIITTPAAILTTIFGLWLLALRWSYYMTQGWMHIKILFVIFLWAYYLYCGKLVGQFKRDRNRHSAKFYRWFNEIPTVLLIVIVILVVVKP